jgi:hypothetical protein
MKCSGSIKTNNQPATLHMDQIRPRVPMHLLHLTLMRSLEQDHPIAGKSPYGCTLTPHFFYLTFTDSFRYLKNSFRRPCTLRTVNETAINEKTNNERQNEARTYHPRPFPSSHTMLLLSRLVDEQEVASNPHRRVRPSKTSGRHSQRTSW